MAKSSLGVGRVQQMVCPLCARMNGQKHVEGCPDSANYPDHYREGWVAARDGLLPPFAGILDALREIAEMPEPLNNKGSTQTQCAYLKEVARKALS